MMKKRLVSIFLTLLLTLTLYLPNGLAQSSPQWHLPEGAIARLGKGSISETRYSPDGTILAVASSIGIWLYDAHNGKELDLLTDHTARVTRISFSPDGKTLAGGMNDRSIRLWDMDTRTQKQTLRGHTGSDVRSVSFSPDGKMLASGSWEEIRLWDVNTGINIQILTGHTSFVNSVSFSPDGKTLASAGSDQIIRLWNVADTRHPQMLMGHTSSVNSISFSPDGSMLASGSYDQTIRLWDVNTGAEKQVLTGDVYGFNSVSFSPDGKTLASGGFSGTHLWDVDTGILKQKLVSGTLSGVSFSPDGKTLASGVYVWDVETGTQMYKLMGHTSSGSSISFSPNGKTVASASGATILLWDIKTRTQKQTFLAGRTLNNVSFSPDGRFLAGKRQDHQISLWDVDTGTLKRTLPGDSLSTNISGMSFSPDGETLASTSAGHIIRLWDIETGNQFRTFIGHTDHVRSVSFNPNGKTLASAGSDGTIRLWNVETGTQKQILSEHRSFNSVAFSPDGKTLVSGSGGGTIRVWDVQTRTYRQIRARDGASWFSASFSPDGKILIGWGTNIHLWNVDTLTRIQTFSGPPWIESVSFSPDGKTLASAGFDGTVFLWNLGPSPISNTTVYISATLEQSPTIGELLTFPLNITGGKNVAGYQVTVAYDTTTLRYVESAKGDYLHANAFFVPPIVEENEVTLAATSLSGENNGDGTLATLTFEIVALKSSTLKLSEVSLIDSDGVRSSPQIEDTEIEIIETPVIAEDVNEDGVVNILDLVAVASNFGKTGESRADVNEDGVVDIVDLVLVAGAIRSIAGAPSVWDRGIEITTTRAKVQQWLTQARGLELTDTSQKGIIFLEQLLAALTPKETTLLPNYPNPFNPETWIPYQLAEPANVTISIYAANGRLVRTLKLGHQPIGIYESRSRAAYWNGRNAVGESVASGVYLYTLTTEDFTATRKMLIRK